MLTTLLFFLTVNVKRDVQKPMEEFNDKWTKMAER